MKFDEFELLFKADLFGNIIAGGNHLDLHTFYDLGNQRARKTIVKQTYDFFIEHGLVIGDETPGAVARAYLIELERSNVVDPSELAMRALLKRNICGRA